MFDIYNSATLEYSSLSNNILTREAFINQFNDEQIVIGAFDNEDNKLSAYAVTFYYKSHENKKCNALNLSILKISPEKKRKSPSAALMNYICTYFLNEKKLIIFVMEKDQLDILLIFKVI